GGVETRTGAWCGGVGSKRSLPYRLGKALFTLRCSPSLVMTMAAGVLINIPVGSTWLDPSWLVRERGYDHSRATLFLGVCFLLGGSLGNFVGGWLGDLFHKRWSGGGVASPRRPVGVVSSFLRL